MLRDVIEEPNFTDEFDLLRNVFSRMDDVHEALTFGLSSDPRIGAFVQGFPHPTIRILRTTPIGDTPAFLVLYRFTADQVLLIGIDEAVD
jgi:hypothetical protein